MGETIDPCYVVTSEFRVSFPHLYEPQAMEEGNEKKYSVVMLFPKTADLAPLKAAAAAAIAAKWGNKPPKGLRDPFRDGDEKELDGYAGMVFLRASSKEAPGVFDAAVQAIPKERQGEFYAGCFARAGIRAFAYERAGNRGVAFALKRVQKLRDGEAFGSKRAVEDDFGPATAQAGEKF